MKKAILYRMLTDKHICPCGIKSKDLLEREEYQVEDYHLTTREETDKLKQKFSVETTPQTFIKEERVGGFDDLKVFWERNQKRIKTPRFMPLLA